MLVLIAPVELRGTVTARLRGATSDTSPALPSWTLAAPTLAPAAKSGLACQAPKPHSISRVDSWTRGVPARQSGQHLDQAAAVLVGRAGEAVARFIGMAGLEAVCARHVAEDRIAIGLGDVLSGAEGLAPGEARLPVEFFVEVGKCSISARARLARSRADT